MGELVSPAVGRITSPYGPRKAPKPGASTNHKGTDIADVDDVIVAAAAGTVVAARYAEGRGNYVTIDIGAGVRVLVQHLASIGVAVGARVAARQRLGVEGRTGTATGIHCHIEVTVNGVLVDPARWFAAHGVTLGSSSVGIWNPSTQGDIMDKLPVLNWATQNNTHNEWDERVQGLLVAAESYDGVIDGLRGPISQDGLEAFQIKTNSGNGKGGADLIIGDKTWESLLTGKVWPR